MLSYPFTSQVTYDDEGLPLYDRAVDSKFLRKVYAKYFSDGVFFKPTNSLQVVADTGMQVVVESGTCHIQGAIGIEETRRTLVVQASEEQDRIDTVVARLDLSLAVRSVDLYVVKGVAAESPQAPALTRDATTWEIGLANLFVAKNTQTISQQRITDTRLDTDRCGQVTQAPGDFDTAPYFAQLQAAIDQYNKDTAAQLAEIQAKAEAQLADQAADLTAWFGVKDEEFTGWFETIKGKLGEDPVGSLQNQVNALNAAVTGYALKLTAGTNALQITAKRNSIESLTVEGVTKQEGSGDAGLENKRAISVATKRMVACTLTSSLSWIASLSSNSGKYYFTTTIPVKPLTGTDIAQAKESQYCSHAVIGNADTADYKDTDCAWVYATESSTAVRIKIGSASTVEEFKKILDKYETEGTPITIWYVPDDVSKATCIYLPIERTDESGYHCDCIELSADLCEGDKVETCVKSGCDKRIVLSGTEKWYTSNTGVGTYRYVFDGAVADAAPGDGSNAEVFYSNVYPCEVTTNNAVEGFVLTKNGSLYIQDLEYNSADMLAEFKQHLADLYAAGTPVVAYYRSITYNEKNDIPVQKEEHVNGLAKIDEKSKFSMWRELNGGTSFTITSTVGAKFVQGGKETISDILPSVTNAQLYTTLTSSTHGIGIGNSGNLCVAVPGYSTVEDILGYFTEYNAIAEYPLATPTIYARDPVHIQTIDGATNINTPEGCTLEIDVARNEAKEYAATLTNAGWQSSGSEYTQTAEVKCVEGLGFVSPDSSFDGVIWANQTEDLALNAELTEALGPINTGYLTLGDGTITCRVAEKPARDIEIHFKAKR